MGDADAIFGANHPKIDMFGQWGRCKIAENGALSIRNTNASAMGEVLVLGAFWL